MSTGPKSFVRLTDGHWKHKRPQSQGKLCHQIPVWEKALSQHLAFLPQPTNSVLACWLNGYVGMRIKKTLITIQGQTQGLGFLVFVFFLNYGFSHQVEGQGSMQVASTWSSVSLERKDPALCSLGIVSSYCTLPCCFQVDDGQPKWHPFLPHGHVLRTQTRQLLVFQGACQSTGSCLGNPAGLC